MEVGGRRVVGRKGGRRVGGWWVGRGVGVGGGR